MNKQNEFNEAIINNNVKIIKKLLNDKDFDPSYDENEPIHNASSLGQIEIVKLLLNDKRVDPSDYNNHAIRISSVNLHIEVVEELLKDKRVDPSAESNYSIISSFLSGFKYSRFKTIL